MAAVKKHFLITAALVLTTGPALAAPWVRGFVVDNYEPAFYYGGRSGTEEPGSDCPKGTIPILDYKKVLKTSWRTDAEIEKITLPVSAGGLGERIVSPAMQHRGFRRDIVFVYLEIDPATAKRRVDARKGHFMPASLVDSQFAILEPPAADERALTLDAMRPVGELVAAAVRQMR